ncbi:hypothetical protein ABZ883_18560 [Streptomyces sp. NPDC046977]|uniref:hypothetical protein n=1 Tax=Streptomyces sp. NPDC046977 TaxID=3154703 RepID=UPI0033EDA5CB
MSGEAWLGDLLRAGRALGASTPEEWARIAAALGLGHDPPDGTARVARDTPVPGDRAVNGPPRDHEEPGPPDAGHRPGRHRPPTAREDDDTPDLAPVERTSPLGLRWTVDPLPPPDGRSSLAAPLPHTPLLAPRSTAAILRTALSRITAEGELDVETAAEQLARARPLHEIPRRPLPTLRYGVQVLADISAGMEPFAGDVQDIIGQVRAQAGVASTQVLRFCDVPTRGAGPGPRGAWQAYRPPQQGRRVLVLSDLGAGGPPFNPWRARPEEWHRTVHAIRQRGCDVVALVPLPERQWPKWWRTLLPVVPWDRGTTVSRVLGVVG